MAYTVGQAFLQIVPSFAGVVNTIEAQASDWGEKAAQAFNKAFGAGTSGGGFGPSDEETESEGSSAGGKFADAFRTRVDAALKSLPDASVNLNDTDAEAKLDDLRARLETLRGAEIGVDLTDSDALAAIDILKGELDELGAKSPSIRVKVDAAEASTELAAIGAEADAVGAESDTASGGLSSLGSAASSAGGAFPELAAGVAALATALIPIGGLAAGALAALPALLAGAGSGIAALGIGFSGISGAVQAYTQQQAQAATASAKSGAAANTAAEQAVSAAQTERNAANSVASAQEALANAQQQAAQRTASAQESLASAQQSAANSVQSANEELTHSEQSLAEAEYNEQQAQIALTAARKDAAEQLVSLNDQVADGSLAIRTAQLQLTTAQNTLNAAKATPGTTALQLKQDQLAYDQAKQHLQDLQDQQAVLVTQEQAAAAAGVTGAQEVTEAQHQLTQAVQSVGTSQQDVADKTVALAQAQATAVQKVADAETALQQAQVSGAQSISDAQKQLTNALADQASALQEIALQADGAGTGGGAAGATNAFAQAMSQLSPAGQAFVNFLTGTVLPQYDAFRDQVQQALLPGITQALVDLQPVFNTLEPYIIQAATAIGKLAVKFAQFLSSPAALRDLNTLLQAGAKFMTQMGTAALVLFGALLSGGAKAAPLLKTIGKVIDSLVKSFAKWVTGGGLTGFLKWIKTNGPSIVGDIESIFSAVGKFIVALEPLGQSFLDVAGLIANFISLVLRIPGLLTPEPILFFASHWSEAWNDIQSVAEAVWNWIFGNILQPIVDFFTNTIPHAFDVTVGFFSAMWGDIEGAALAAWNWLNGNVFQPIGNFFTNTIPHALDDAVGFFTALPGRITGALSTVWGAITGAFGDAASWVTAHVIQPIVGFFTGLPSDITKAMSDVANAVETVFTHVLGGIIDAVNGIIDLLNDVINGYNDIPFVPNIPDIPKVHRATGGSVMAGQAYVVGEVGPELFVPQTNGLIVPNSDLQGGKVAASAAVGPSGLTDGDRALLRRVASATEGLAERPTILQVGKDVLARTVNDVGQRRRLQGAPGW